MEKCKFYNVEVMDGYFSGVAYIYEIDKRYIVEISYDIEFEQIRLRNCSDVMHNSAFENYGFEELEELKNRNYYEIKNAIQSYIEDNGSLIFANY